MSGAITGLAGSQLWNQPTRPVDFFDIKGIVEAFLQEIGIRDYQLRPASHPSLQPDRSAEITVEDAVMGVIGEVHRNVLSNYDFDQDIYVFELDFSKLLTYATPEIKFQSLPMFPSIHRDMAVVVAFDVPSSQIKDTIKSVGGDLVRSVNLFDVYTGKQISGNMRSLAYSIEYYSPVRTLTDEEVDQVQERIISALAEKFGAELRK